MNAKNGSAASSAARKPSASNSRDRAPASTPRPAANARTAPVSYMTPTPPRAPKVRHAEDVAAELASVKAHIRELEAREDALKAEAIERFKAEGRTAISTNDGTVSLLAATASSEIVDGKAAADLLARNGFVIPMKQKAGSAERIEVRLNK